jgi:hypothetical protein
MNEGYSVKEEAVARLGRGISDDVFNEGFKKQLQKEA